MAQYLVLAPAGTADESLLQELTRLAARESSHFHVVVPRRPGGDSAADLDLVAEHHLSALLDALAARGLDADGELGEVSVVGSVARATERTHYDAVVFSLATVGVVETIDLEVARRLHQIDVPLFNLVTPGRPGGAAAPPMKASFRSADRRGLVVGGVLLLILAIVVVVLESRLGTLA